VKHETPIAYFNECLNCKKDGDAELYPIQGLVVLTDVFSVGIVIDGNNYGVQNDSKNHQYL
jgi:hypothetical protein